MLRRPLRGVARGLARGLVALLLGGAAMAAAAHDFHMGIADISYNARTGSTEVVHTYAAHDVAALLASRYRRQFDLGQADTEAPLRSYVEQQFYLTTPDGKRAPLRWIGFKADADSVVIFQELPHTRLAPGTRIHNALLMEAQPGQKNSVNVQLGSQLQTLFFAPGSTDQTAR